jgi:hypothetical protein
LLARCGECLIIWNKADLILGELRRNPTRALIAALLALNIGPIVCHSINLIAFARGKKVRECVSFCP